MASHVFTELEADRQAVFLAEIKNAEKISESYCREHFPKRLEKARRFRFRDDRYRCLCAGVLLHEILGIEETEIRYNEFGKPFTVSGMAFSLSHSGKYAALAVSSACVGVDIEQTEEDCLDLMPHIFTKEEILYAGQDRKRFYTLWTLKESLVKAVGTGLDRPMQEIPVFPLLCGNAVDWLGKTWHGFSQPVDEGKYILSCVSETAEKPEIIRLASFSGMLPEI